MRSLRVNEYDMAYIERGSGPRMVLLFLMTFERGDLSSGKALA